MTRNSRSPNESRSDGSESLSDIDDFALDKYLLTAKERSYKTKIWEALNKEYVEEQAFKEASIRQKSQNTEKTVKEKKRKINQDDYKSSHKEEMQNDSKRKKVESQNAVDIDKYVFAENLNEENNDDYTEHGDYLCDNNRQNNDDFFDFDF